VTHSTTDPIWLRLLPSFIRNKLSGRDHLHAAIHNSGWIFFDKILRAVIGLVVGAWVARYLGPEQFGELAYCIAFIAIFQSITNLGLDGIVVREIANQRHRANDILGTVFQLRLLLGITCWMLALVLYGIGNGFSGQGIWIIGFIGAGMIFQVADTVDLWFQGNSQSKRTVLAKASAYLISNGIRVALILLSAPLIAFAVVVMLEGALTALALSISYKRYPSDGIWKSNLQDAKKLLGESWPYMLSGFSIIIYMRIDQLMIKSMLGDFELGIYSAVVPISNLWNMIPVTICASIAPYMAKKKMEGQTIFDSALLKVFRLFWLLSLAVIALTVVLSSFLIDLMYGDAYQEAASVLNIYVLTSIPVFMGVGQGLWMLNYQKSYLSVIQTISGAIVALVANFVLLPMWGVQGAAVAAILSQAISAMCINAIFARELFLMQMGIRLKKVADLNV
jgi:O-antigen/teichoic acid export membrane protein